MMEMVMVMLSGLMHTFSSSCALEGDFPTEFCNHNQLEQMFLFSVL